MSTIPPSPWIHIGECPFCVNGLVRVRSCIGNDMPRHLYALCDECEAVWKTPSTSDERFFPDPENPKCPTCAADLYGEAARWALPEDLVGTDWESQAIFTLADDCSTSTPDKPAEAEPNITDQFVEQDDEPNRGC